MLFYKEMYVLFNCRKGLTASKSCDSLIINSLAMGKVDKCEIVLIWFARCLCLPWPY